MIKAKEKITMLPVMEHFYTLQGEGFHQGKLPILFALEVVMLDAFGVM
jgi:hypothetical protein